MRHGILPPYVKHTHDGFCELEIHSMFEINHHAKCFDDLTSH
jgi:hypothetical protein